PCSPSSATPCMCWAASWPGGCASRWRELDESRSLHVGEPGWRAEASVTPPPASVTPPPASAVPALEGAGVGAADGPLTPEDLARSHDRFRVYNARRQRRRWSLLWLLIGPGILAMLGENDGPSMISYATTGATYGLGFFLPFIVITFAMAIVCQEMCMRVGAVTHRGYGQLVLERFGPIWGWFGAGDLI